MYGGLIVWPSALWNGSLVVWRPWAQLLHDLLNNGLLDNRISEHVIDCVVQHNVNHFIGHVGAILAKVSRSHLSQRQSDFWGLARAVTAARCSMQPWEGVVRPCRQQIIDAGRPAAATGLVADSWVLRRSAGARGKSGKVTGWSPPQPTAS